MARRKRNTLFGLVAYTVVLFITSAASAGERAKALSRMTVVAEGDSLTYGQDGTANGVSTQINGAPQTRSVTPYPEEMQRAFGTCATVINHGFPGDRTVDGLVRWQAAPAAAVYVIMFGTNDAFNYGGASTGPLSIESYKETLGLLIDRRTSRGAKVLVLGPPALMDKERESKLSAYVDAAKAVAATHGADFYATDTGLVEVAQLWTDGVHLTPDAYANIAAAVRSKIGKWVGC